MEVSPGPNAFKQLSAMYLFYLFKYPLAIVPIVESKESIRSLLINIVHHTPVIHDTNYLIDGFLQCSGHRPEPVPLIIEISFFIQMIGIERLFIEKGVDDRFPQITEVERR